MGSSGRVLDNNKSSRRGGGAGPAFGWAIGWVEAVRVCGFWRQVRLSSVCRETESSETRSRVVRLFPARAAEFRISDTVLASRVHACRKYIVHCSNYIMGSYPASASRYTLRPRNGRAQAIVCRSPARPRRETHVACDSLVRFIQVKELDQRAVVQRWYLAVIASCLTRGAPSRPSFTGDLGGSAAMAESLPPIDHLVRTSAKRAHALFSGDQAFTLDDSVDARR